MPDVYEIIYFYGKLFILWRFCTVQYLPLPLNKGNKRRRLILNKQENRPGRRPPSRTNLRD